MYVLIFYWKCVSIVRVMSVCVGGGGMCPCSGEYVWCLCGCATCKYVWVLDGGGGGVMCG